MAVQPLLRLFTGADDDDDDGAADSWVLTTHRYVVGEGVVTDMETPTCRRTRNARRRGSLGDLNQAQASGWERRGER